MGSIPTSLSFTSPQDVNGHLESKIFSDPSNPSTIRWLTRPATNNALSFAIVSPTTNEPLFHFDYGFGESSGAPATSVTFDNKSFARYSITSGTGIVNQLHSTAKITDHLEFSNPFNSKYKYTWTQSTEGGGYILTASQLLGKPKLESYPQARFVSAVDSTGANSTVSVTGTLSVSQADLFGQSEEEVAFMAGMAVAVGLAKMRKRRDHGVKPTSAIAASGAFLLCCEMM